MNGFLVRTDNLIGHAMRAIPIFCLTALFFLLFINVTARTFSLAGFAWFDEIVHGLFAWMVFMGAAALWRENLHFRVDWLEAILGDSKAGKFVALFVALLSLGFSLAVAHYGYDLTTRSRAMTPILALPTALFYAVIPLSGALMALYSLRDLFIALKNFKKTEKSHDLRS